MNDEDWGDSCENFETNNQSNAPYELSKYVNFLISISTISNEANFSFNECNEIFEDMDEKDPAFNIVPAINILYVLFK
uniref:Uncharacterized protein n=1 Tax=Strongyloides stercoralis TaxID=6248 RepID=A0A0K0E4B2_STRER